MLKYLIRGALKILRESIGIILPAYTHLLRYLSTASLIRLVCLMHHLAAGAMSVYYMKLSSFSIKVLQLSKGPPLGLCLPLVRL